jgi:hypothetical protein
MLSLFALPARDAKARLPSTLWAAVDKDGHLQRGKGVAASFKYTGGTVSQYAVIFKRDVSNCAYAAPALDNYYGINISVAPDTSGSTPNYLVVYTYSGTSLYDAPFSLVVNC